MARRRSVDPQGEFSNHHGALSVGPTARMVAPGALFSDLLHGRHHRILIGPSSLPARRSVLVVENLIIEIRHGLPSLRPRAAIESPRVSLCLNNHRRRGTVWQSSLIPGARRFGVSGKENTTRGWLGTGKAGKWYLMPIKERQHRIVTDVFCRLRLHEVRH